MASSLASSACIAPRAVAFRVRGRVTHRPARAVQTRAATYDEVFDGVSGQMVPVLSQSVESLSAGGLDWSYRLGVPEDDVEQQPNTVVLVHGAGMLSYTYSKLMKELQLKGYTCVAPDMPGHGASSKPSPSSFKYDLKAYQSALSDFVNALNVTMEDDMIDLVVSGFFTSQGALLFAAANPDKVRRVVVLNAPLGNGHKLPDPLGVYGRPFGMGKGANADVYKLAYFGNEFAIPAERMEVYEAPYVGGEAAAARDAFEATATSVSPKDAMQSVTDAFSKRGSTPPPKVRVVWGASDKYLNDAPMYKWCDDVRASFDVMRKVGHMPHEDFAEETAKFVASFLQSEGKVGALKSVRLGKIGKDDDYDRN